MLLALLVSNVAAVLAQTATPSVTVADQAIVDGTVNVGEVVSSGAGWIVIHTQADGKPGPVIGHAAVVDGKNSSITVTIETTKATEMLYAMLHTDAGTVGTYEFPGADAPVMVDGQMVTPAYKE